MPATTVSGSTNISSLDVKIVSDLCLGKLFIDGTPSVFIGGGASNVLGAKVQVTNPYGVIIKAYTGAYDIAAPITAIYEMTFPTQGGKYVYGTYTIELEITDANGTSKYTVSKSIYVCPYPDDVNPGESCTKLVPDCTNGRLDILMSEPPAYQGKSVESKTQTVRVDYPTASGLPFFATTIGNFSVRLFEGVYKITSTICATYNLGDNKYVKIGYTGIFEKNVKCLIDYSCVWPKVKQLQDKVNSDCSAREKDDTASTILEVMWTIKGAEIAAISSNDPSDFIDRLEELLGCSCTCECSLSSPIINASPSSNFSIIGCNVEKITSGLTDQYTINNYHYIVSVDDSTGVIAVSAPALTDCTYNQSVTFNIANLYSSFKTQINNLTENNYWASVVNPSLDGVDYECLGYTEAQWLAMSFFARINAIAQSACSGVNCIAIVSAASHSKVGDDVLLTWTVTNAYKVEIYVDGVLMGTQLAAVNSITLDGFANANVHDYIIRPFCENGVAGVLYAGTFTYSGCPTIIAPNVSSSNVSNAVCPYDLTGLPTGTPVGLTAEWHNLNNTMPSSLVADPTAVTDGTYFVFYKNTDGCYSSGTQVIVTCQVSGTVTAPQNLSVTPITGAHLVQFESAAFPPPANSYTLKRRLSSDPDVSGSYTTLGSTGSGIAFNSSTNRWELSDTTAAANTLYVYRAISNGGSSPSIDLTYANLTCPSLGLTNTQTSIGYSFNNVGGGVDKYDIELYNAAGTSLLQTSTEVPAFATPITGTFSGLTAGTYKVRAKVYIGAYVHTCAFETRIIEENSITGTTAYSFAVSSGVGDIIVNDPAGAILTISTFGGTCSNAQFSLNVNTVGTINANVNGGPPNQTVNATIFVPQGTFNFNATFPTVTGCGSTGTMSISQ